jgi:hypothetical protein
VTTHTAGDSSTNAGRPDVFPQGRPASPTETFWLGYGKSMVEQAVTSRENAAGKLVTGIAWFWTVYSSVTVATLLQTRTTGLVTAVALILPSALLIAAYLTGLHALHPVKVSFTLNSPSDIRQTYEILIARKVRRLRLAYVLTALAGGAVVLAILVTALATRSA